MCGREMIRIPPVGVDGVDLVQQIILEEELARVGGVALLVLGRLVAVSVSDVDHGVQMGSAACTSNMLQDCVHSHSQHVAISGTRQSSLHEAGDMQSSQQYIWTAKMMMILVLRWVRNSCSEGLEKQGERLVCLSSNLGQG